MGNASLVIRATSTLCHGKDSTLPQTTYRTYSRCGDRTAAVNATYRCSVGCHAAFPARYPLVNNAQMVQGDVFLVFAGRPHRSGRQVYLYTAGYHQSDLRDVANPQRHQRNTSECESGFAHISVVAWAASHLMIPRVSAWLLGAMGETVTWRQALSSHAQRLPAKYLPGGIGTQSGALPTYPAYRYPMAPSLDLWRSNRYSP